MLVIPAIDLRAGRCVRLRRGDPTVETVFADDPGAVARRFVAAGAELLHVVDLDAALGTGSNGDAVRAIRAAVDVPLQVGGGLRTSEAIEAAIGLGDTRVVLGTAAASEPLFVAEAAARWGDGIVVAVDVKANTVMVDGWRAPAGPVERIVPALVDAGALRLMVTAVSADGTMGGPELPLYERIRALTDRSVIASGGIRDAADIGALAACGVEAAVVGRALYEGALALPDAITAGAMAGPVASGRAEPR